MTAKLFSIYLLGALTLTASGQTARFVGESLVITDGARRIRLPEIIEPHPIARCVHAVQKRKADYFILFGAPKLSRGYSPRNGNCGTGVESHVIWLHVRGGKVLERQEALYESCFDNRDGWKLGWAGPLFSVESEDLVEESVAAGKSALWRTLKWTFDVRHPEAAFTEEQQEHADP